MGGKVKNAKASNIASVAKGAEKKSNSIIKNVYLHSHWETFERVFYADCAGQKPFQGDAGTKDFFQQVIKQKKQDLKNFSTLLGYDNEQDLMKDIKKGQHSKDKAEIISGFLEETANEFLATFATQDLEDPGKMEADLLVDVLMDYLSGTPVVSKGEGSSIEVELEATPMQREKYYKGLIAAFEERGVSPFFIKKFEALLRGRPMDSSDIRGASGKLAQSISTTTFFQQFGDRVGKQSEKEAVIGDLKDFLEKSKSPDTITNKGQLSSIYGFIGEIVAAQAFGEKFGSKESVEVLFKGTEQSAAGTVKQDIAIVFDSGDAQKTLGVSVKSGQEIEWQGEAALTMPIQTLTVTNLKNYLAQDGIGSIADSYLEKLYYVLVNYDFFNKQGARVYEKSTDGKKSDGGKFKRLSREKMQAVTDFIDDFVYSLSAIWLGTSFSESTKDNEIGLLYDHVSREVIPMYEVLEEIQKSFDGKRKTAGLKWNISGVDYPSPGNVYKKKLSMATQEDQRGKSRNVASYSSDFLEENSFGKEALAKMKMKISLAMLKSVFGK